MKLPAPIDGVKKMSQCLSRIPRTSIPSKANGRFRRFSSNQYVRGNARHVSQEGWLPVSVETDVLILNTGYLDAISSNWAIGESGSIGICGLAPGAIRT